MTARIAKQDAFLQAAIGGGYESQPLKGDASFRRYIRIIQDDRHYMLMDAPPQHEPVTAFLTIDRYLYDSGYSAPRVIAADEQEGFVLLEDLGDDSFTRLLAADASCAATFYKAAIALLANWHQGGLDADQISLPLYDEAVLLRELELFSNWFLPQILDGTMLEQAQESYLEGWQDCIAKAGLQMNYFVHRDFHADNLMWLPKRSSHGKVGLLDFQDALLGDVAYDVVSLLEDARRDVPPALAEEMIQYYLSLSGRDETEFRRHYALLGAQRNAKIIGIFTRLAARDGKDHYLHYLPRVWGCLLQDVTHPQLEFFAGWLEKYVPAGKRGVIAIRKDASVLGLAA